METMAVIRISQLFFEEFEDIAYGKFWRFNGRKSKEYLKSKMCGNLYVEFKNVTE